MIYSAITTAWFKNPASSVYDGHDARLKLIMTDSERKEMRSKVEFAPAVLYMMIANVARQVETDDGNVVFNFQDRLSAERLSILLQKIGIVGSSGNRKFVAVHVKEDNDVGIVLNRNNLDIIRDTYVEIYSSKMAFRDRMGNFSTDEDRYAEFAEEDAAAGNAFLNTIDQELPAGIK